MVFKRDNCCRLHDVLVQKSAVSFLLFYKLQQLHFFSHRILSVFEVIVKWFYTFKGFYWKLLPWFRFRHSQNCWHNCWQLCFANWKNCQIAQSYVILYSCLISFRFVKSSAMLKTLSCFSFLHVFPVLHLALCLFKCSAWLKHSPHRLHSKGFSLVCILSCFFKFPAR